MKILGKGINPRIKNKYKFFLKSMNILTIYGGHDSSCTFINKDETLSVLEYERICKKRYAAFAKDGEKRIDIGTTDQQRLEFLTYVAKNISKEPDVIWCNALESEDIELLKTFWPNSEYKCEVIHHLSHAACGYYQSEFNEALIISADGGGTDEGVSTTTKIFTGDSGGIKSVHCIGIDFGAAYGKIGYPISEISKKSCNLAIAGKVMGLCAYGKVVEDWIDPIQNYYLIDQHSLPKLSERLGFDVNTHDCLSGQKGYDLAATSQYVFEKLMLSIVKEHFDPNPKNLIFTGGCALNVLFNQKLKDYVQSKGYKLYVPPNPNDCGLSLGQYLYHTAQKIKPVVYGNFDILDKEKIENYKQNYNFLPISIEKIVDLISNGKIGAIIQGKSEVGPRSLGNRSIICDPSFSDMKDVLNAKVKFREWFRPFAPVCKLEDKDIYFEDACESEYMSFAPIVREEYREKLISITHADNTSRLQTVTIKQHKLFYEILTAMKKVGKVPVILNTSFNIKGKPILTTYEDAFHVLKETELDFLITENFIVEK